MYLYIAYSYCTVAVSQITLNYVYTEIKKYGQKWRKLFTIQNT